MKINEDKQNKTNDMKRMIKLVFYDDLLVDE